MPSCKTMKESTNLMHARIDCTRACMSECARLQRVLAISLFVRSIFNAWYVCPAPRIVHRLTYILHIPACVAPGNITYERRWPRIVIGYATFTIHARKMEQPVRQAMLRRFGGTWLHECASLPQSTNCKACRKAQLLASHMQASLSYEQFIGDGNEAQVLDMHHMERAMVRDGT